MATSAQSTVWPAADLGHVSVARPIGVRLTRSKRRRLLLCPAPLALGAGLLASCAAHQAQPPSQALVLHRMPPPDIIAPAPAVPRPVHKPNPPTPAENPASAAAREDLTEQQPMASAPLPEVSSPSPDVTPSSSPLATAAPQTSELIGLDERAATRLFGPAPERSEQPPATIWRYKNATCQLDLFFYLDLSSGQMRTLHYSLKGGGPDTARRQDCLRSLVASRSS
jgi:hypothetical protein